MASHKDEILGYAPTVVFLHIPKTAGQSLVKAFGEIYPSSDALAIYTDPSGNLMSIDGYDYDLESALPPRLITGHINYGSIDRILGREERRWITFLRDPLERLVSQYLFDRDYYFAHQYNQSDYEKIFSETPDDYILNSGNWVYDNCMTRMISGIGGMLPVGSLNKATLDMAINNLNKMYFVGFQQYFNKSLAELSYKLNIQPLQIFTENKQENRVASKNIQHDLKISQPTLIRKNLFDLQLYYYALEKYISTTELSKKM